MSICYPYFIVAFSIGIIGINVPNLHVLDTKEYRLVRNKYRLSTILISVIVVIFSAFRMISAASIDEFSYRNRFTYYAGMDFISAIKETTEPIFAGMVWLSTRVFSTNQGIIIVTGSVTVLLLLGAIKKYSSDYSFACVVLFVSGVMYTTFNGIQQYLATAIIVFAFDAAYNKKLKKFLILVILCSLIHNSSVFLLIFYPLANEKTGNKKMWIYNAVFLIAGLFFYQAVPILAEKYGMLTAYVDILSSGHHGVQKVTIIINMIPALLALVCRRNLYGDKVTSSFANIAILHAMIYILAAVDVYIARLAIFTAPFTVIFLSRIMRYIKDARIVKLLAIVLYAIVCYLQLRGIVYTFNFVR